MSTGSREPQLTWTTLGQRGLALNALASQVFDELEHIEAKVSQAPSPTSTKWEILSETESSCELLDAQGRYLVKLSESGPVVLQCYVTSFRGRTSEKFERGDQKFIIQDLEELQNALDEISQLRKKLFFDAS